MHQYFVQQLERATHTPVGPRVVFSSIEEATQFRTVLSKAVDYNRTKLVIGEIEQELPVVRTGDLREREALRSRRSTGRILMSLLQLVASKEERPGEMWGFSDDGRVQANVGALDLHRSSDTGEWDLVECTSTEGDSESLINWPGLAAGGKLSTREMEAFLRGMLAAGAFQLAE